MELDLTKLHSLTKSKVESGKKVFALTTESKPRERPNKLPVLSLKTLKFSRESKTPD